MQRHLSICTWLKCETGNRDDLQTVHVHCTTGIEQNTVKYHSSQKLKIRKSGQNTK